MLLVSSYLIQNINKQSQTELSGWVQKSDMQAWFRGWVWTAISDKDWTQRPVGVTSGALDSGSELNVQTQNPGPDWVQGSADQTGPHL